MNAFGAALARRASEPGALALALALTSCFFAWAYSFPALWLFGFLIAGLCALDAFYAWRVLRRVTLSRLAPQRARADWPFELELQVHNTHAFAPLSGVIVRDALAGQAAAVSWAVFPWLSAGETRHVTTLITPRRRGLHRFEASLMRTGFPLGLWSAERMREAPAELMVHPRSGRVAEALFLRLEQLESTRRARRASRSDDEFRGLREWRHGDNPRRIHWRRSARLGSLVVKEYEEARAARLTVVLDTLATRGRTAALAEEAISFAAALAQACHRRGLVLSLVFGHGAALQVLDIGGGRASVDIALDRLACLELHATSDPSHATALAALPLKLFRDRHVLCLAARELDLPSDELRQKWRRCGAEIWRLPAEGRDFARYFRRATSMEHLRGTRRASRTPKLLEAT